jgi:hypothetical protein
MKNLLQNSCQRFESDPGNSIENAGPNIDLDGKYDSQIEKWGKQTRRGTRQENHRTAPAKISHIKPCISPLPSIP